MVSPELFLAEGAEMGGALAEPDPLDGPAATRTGLARPSVCFQLDLEFALDAVAVGEIANGRSAQPDGPAQDAPYRPAEAADFGRREIACSPQGMEFRFEQNLVGVDISDAGQGGLIEEEALEAGLPAGQDGPKPGEGNPKRLGAESSQERTAAQLVRPRDAHISELAHVPEDEPARLVPEGEYDMGVLIQPARISREQESPGHLEMEYDRPAALAIDQDELPAPPDASDGPPAQRRQVRLGSLPQNMRRPDAHIVDD